MGKHSSGLVFDLVNQTPSPPPPANSVRSASTRSVVSTRSSIRSHSPGGDSIYSSVQQSRTGRTDHKSPNNPTANPKLTGAASRTSTSRGRPSYHRHPSGLDSHPPSRIQQEPPSVGHHSNIEPGATDLDEPSFGDNDIEQASSSSLHSSSSPPSIRSPHTNPLRKHLRDLNGTWQLSKTLSTGVPSCLEIQGYDSARRKAIIASPMSLWISQSHYPSQIFAKEITTTVAQTRTERWYPSHNGQWSEWWTTSSAGMGGGYVTTKSRCRWTKGTEFEQGDRINYLTQGLSMTGEFLHTEVECKDMRWKQIQVWFMDQGRLVKRVVTIADVGKTAETTLVYDFAE